MRIMHTSERRPRSVVTPPRAPDPLRCLGSATYRPAGRGSGRRRPTHNTQDDRLDKRETLRSAESHDSRSRSEHLMAKASARCLAPTAN
jgi:hypothetical protein